jgi:hypothetical protein
MIKLGNHPGASRVLAPLEGLFKSEEAFFSIHQHLSFVCGAQGDKLQDGTPNLRSQFLRHLDKQDDGHRILPILAEKAIDEVLRADDGVVLDLAIFEDLIAQIVDSVLLFPESPGSFAELGFFAAKPEICKKTLVATKQEYQGQSFINLGPIPIVSRYTIFAPIPIVLGDDLEKGFAQVSERLKFHTSQRKYHKRYGHEDLIKQPPKIQLTLIYELIRFFSFITEQNLLYCINRLFGVYDVERVRRLLAVLVAMEYVSRTEYGDYQIKKDSPPLMEYKGDKFEQIKSRILLFYEQHDPDAFEAVRAI